MEFHGCNLIIREFQGWRKFRKHFSKWNFRYYRIKCDKLFGNDCFIYYARPFRWNLISELKGRYKETLGIFSTLLSEEECSIHTFTRHLWTPHARYQSYQHFYAAYNLMRLYAHVELSGKERQRCKKCYLHGKQSRNLLVEEYSMPILASNIVLIFSLPPPSLLFFFFFLFRDSSATYDIEKQLNIIFAVVWITREHLERNLNLPYFSI